MTEIRNHDVVKVKSTGKISRIIDIHYAFDRYQIKGVSGWQHKISDLEKLNTDSLITTIESQKEEITGLMDALDDSTKIMKWQQVELKKCREVIARFNQATIQLYQGYGEQELKIMVLTNEIESLKAITELAVKGLKDISDIDTSSYSNDVWQIRDIANNTLFEIERLSQ